MAAIPIPPTFITNDSSLVKLQSIAACAKFLTVLDSGDTNTLPAWHLRRSGNQSLTSGNIAFNVVALDSDGVSDGTGALIVTQGIYACEAAVSFSGGSGQLKAYFTITAGASNPNHASSATVNFGSFAVGVSGFNETSVSCADLTPWVCYPGDTIRLHVASGSSVTAQAGGQTSGMTNRCWPTFTGRWYANASAP